MAKQQCGRSLAQVYQARQPAPSQSRQQGAVGTAVRFKIGAQQTQQRLGPGVRGQVGGQVGAVPGLTKEAGDPLTQTKRLPACPFDAIPASAQDSGPWPHVPARPSPPPGGRSSSGAS